MPTTVTRPRPRPQRWGSTIAGARAMAQVPRALRALGMARAPSVPAQANAAASATPWQPTARNTTSDGAVRRGVSRSRGRGVEEAKRHAEPVRDGAHRRLVRLQVEGGDTGHRLGRKSAGHENSFGQEDKLLRCATPLAAEAEGEHGGMQGDIGHVVARNHAPVGDVEGEAAPIPERRATSGEPVGRRRLGHEAHGLAGEQRGGDRLHPRAFAEAPARRRSVEGEAQGRVARRGDGGVGAESVGNGASEPVRAVMAAQQRHDAPPVVRYRDDRGLGALVREMWAEYANEDAGGADADDRRPGPEQGDEVGPEPLVGDIGGVPEGRGTMDRRARQRGRDAAREGQLARIKDHDGEGVQRHAAPRLWTMTMEK